MKKSLDEKKIKSAQKVDSPNGSLILRELSRNEAVYYFSSMGNFTGDCAASLEDFAKKIQRIDIKSIEFHLYRQDFEKWVTETLEDNELAQEIRNLQKQSLTGEFLRQKLQAIVSNRCEQRAQLNACFKPIFPYRAHGPQ